MSDPVDQTWTPPKADPGARGDNPPPNPGARGDNPPPNPGARGDNPPPNPGARGDNPPASDEGSGTAPRVLTGRYLLEERIASGGMASVWRAHDEVLARTVAVKILHDHLAADEGFRERFRREAVAAAKLAHPNVVGLYDTGTDGDRVYLVMEFIDGRTLKDVVLEDGPLPVAEAATIGEQVARALDYAHSRGLVHRDVKPANILMGHDGMVKVTDFGIAKADQADDLTKTGMVLGTAAYVAPEQISGNPVDGKTDQYALAIVLYEALTGQQPFKADTPVATAAQRLERDPLPVRSLRADVPRSVDAVLQRALARDPAERYPSCAELADALSAYAAESASSLMMAPPPLPPTQAAEEDDASFLRSEGRFLAPVLGVLLLVGLLLAAGLWTGLLETREDGFPVGLARPDAADSQIDDPTMELIAPTTFRVFDPLGSGEERDQDLGNIFDGDASTSWRTQLYNSAPFGGLKTGVGFYVDLGSPHEIGLVALRTSTPGVDVELRVADEPAPNPDAWQPVGRIEDGADLLEFRFEEEVTAQYVLVWVTGELPPYQGRYAAEFSQIAIRGAPA